MKPKPIPLSQAKKKLFYSLRTKKGRQKEGLFILEGRKLVQEALREGIPLQALIVSEDFFSSMQDFPEVTLYTCTQRDFDRLSQLETPEGIMAVAPLQTYEFPQNIQNKKFFVLDRLQDPGNLGTIFRICDAFGIDGLILYECVEVYNPKVIRASMGSILRVPFYEVEMSKFLSLYRGKIACTGTQGKNLAEVNLSAYQFIVLGNEGQGILSEWNKSISECVHIPHRGKAESLNVAIACGILAWEWQKNTSSY